jgi:predicted trehalose synthase
VFRALHHGENPDVVLQSAIAGAGSGRVPATYGAVLGEWSDPGRADGRARGHLAVAQEFLADTEDAWRVALAAARGGLDFAAAARDLGAATAEVHQVLAAALPTVPADPEAKRALLAGMRTRAEQAVRTVPSLAGSEDRIGAVLSAAEADDWPPFQRIHGDYHLGQVLSVPGRGWVLLDFEGEPLRPMAERSEPDTPLRDVAGMLRSFDYVAGTLELEDDDPSGRAWADTARDAFLIGYADRLGEPLEPHARLLAALELDKALYECVYEVRNRPAWLPIPERAVHRLA